MMNDRHDTTRHEAPLRLRSKTAFITWAHDSREWEKTIATLAFSLRNLGVEADVDLFHVNDVDVNWATYGIRAIRDNNFVLVAVSPAFKARWEGTNNPRHGAGAAREANALKAIFDDDQHNFFERVKIVVLPDATLADIPLELRSVGQRFEVSSFDLVGLEDLLRTLTGQKAYPAPRVRSVPILPPKFMLEADTSDSSLVRLRSRLAQLDARLSDKVIGDEARRENLDTERITVQAALETVSQRVSEDVGDSAHRAPHVRKRILTIVGSLGAAGITAVVVLTLTSNSAAARLTARSGSLSLSFTQPWHRVRSGMSFPGLEIESPISLANGTATLEAGPIRNYAPVPGDPPSTVMAQLGVPSMKGTASIGYVKVTRDTWDGSLGTLSYALLVIPTETGDLALACISNSPASLSICNQIAASARVSGVRVLSPGQQPKLVDEIAAALAPELAARRRARDGLASSHLGFRAAAARDLAAADTTAARSLVASRVPSRFQTAVRELAQALQQEAKALGDVARAAGQGAVGFYQSARDAVGSAGRDLGQALAAMRPMGYTMSLPALSLNPLVTHHAVSAPVPASPVAPAAVSAAPASTQEQSAPPHPPSRKKSEYGPPVVTEPSN